ncbi:MULTISPECIES: helix-turn-helix domain-containing protein [Methylobacterium]|uniref:helix-turn-helix domain-containing protein n=1 Tax=Methylobacterium TaxID=407 RepID=UPI00272E0CB2|nr:AraC family transcriptional regulator [Methylobacterium sp.]
MTDRIELWHDSGILGGIDILRAECRTCRYGAHAHDAFVIAAFRAGAQKYSIAGTHGVASPGTVMIIPPGEMHTGERAARDGGWTYSALYPGVAALETLSDGFFNRGTLDLGAGGLIEDAALAGALVSAIDVASRPVEALRRQEAICRALALLLRRHGQRAGRSIPGPPPTAPIRRDIDYVMANLDHRLSVEDVAAAVGLSPFHVMRLFKARTGMTVHQFVVHRRLEAARAALATGAAPAEAAARFGFYDQSHFTGHFRRAFGTTPRRYADACR